MLPQDRLSVPEMTVAETVALRKWAMDHALSVAASETARHQPMNADQIATFASRLLGWVIEPFPPEESAP